MSTTFATAKKSIRKERSWKENLLVIRQANGARRPPLLVAWEWWSERSGKLKLKSGATASNSRFHGVGLVLALPLPRDFSDGRFTLKKTERTRSSGILKFAPPLGDTWSTRIAALLGVKESTSPSSRITALLSGDVSDSHLGATILRAITKDASFIADSVFGPSRSSDPLSGNEKSLSSHDQIQILMRSGAGAKSGNGRDPFEPDPSATPPPPNGTPSLSPDYGDDVLDADAEAQRERERFEEGEKWVKEAVDAAKEAGKKIYDWLFQETETDTDTDNADDGTVDDDTSTNPTPDDGTVDDDGRDGLDGDTGSSGRIDVLRTIGGGFRDPQPNDDGSSNLTATSVTLRFLGGGITDPTPTNDNEGTGSDTTLKTLLGGFTDPSPLVFSVQAVRSRLRIS